MRFTRSTQRQSQRTRQQIVAHNKRDYYDCPRCRKLFPRYHGSHKRHIRSCIAKHEARVQEEARFQAERIETPTPDPYSPVLTDAEIDTEDVGTGMQSPTNLMNCTQFLQLRHPAHILLAQFSRCYLW